MTNAIDAVLVERVREALAERAKYFVHPAYEKETTDGAFSWEEVRAIAARLADVEAENADLWTELHLCRQMCRDSQPARLPGDAHG